MTESYSVRVMTGRKARGLALVSKKAFTFAHGVDPRNGNVTDLHSDLLGKNVKGSVLVYPYGKGSTTASAWFLETVRLGNAPAAVVTSSVDPAAVIGSVVAKVLYGVEIPVMLWSDAPSRMRSGDAVEVDAGTGTIRLR
ncbi:MAG: DUF126 domain-containing protein [Nitrososphaerota archaeon]|jgi:predicted aconitase with swiveling domain|nr:DUF126 domain-containing protein [Nitrososphaerota archaeon]MDG6937243.1 DUF126 domain-containing protein [Nitrososphaerota archaeon]MDG6961962.1 DUF126 domain-containing protein [Nitrososphaerota archaeon]MDG6962785.1 DUF126 domain-containing protein [Nitrososphaerota archaeon]MDG6970106.1 DUF126 domain-containing protein [Nitrososphaerota archaeon]